MSIKAERDGTPVHNIKVHGVVEDVRVIFNEAFTLKGQQYPFFERVGTLDTHERRCCIDEDQYGLGFLSKLGVSIDTVMDIGAHIGSFSWNVKRVFNESRVAAVEPMHSNFLVMKKNLDELNSCLFNKALDSFGDSSVIMATLDVDTNMGHMDINKVGTSLSGNRTRVKAITLQNLMQELGGTHLDLLKIDCEGAECDLFYSEYNILKSIKIIVGEFHTHLPFHIIDNSSYTNTDVKKLIYDTLKSSHNLFLINSDGGDEGLRGEFLLDGNANSETSEMFIAIRKDINYE